MRCPRRPADSNDKVATSEYHEVAASPLFDAYLPEKPGSPQRCLKSLACSEIFVFGPGRCG